MGAPLGNQNAAKARKIIGDALRKVVLQDDKERLRKGAEEILNKAATGDLDAYAFVRDTLDGKPKQSMDLGVDPDEDNPLHKLVNAAAELQTKVRGK